MVGRKVIKRHGFTLVELSIGLVIIGLLIGMIHAAKITRAVEEFS